MNTIFGFLVPKVLEMSNFVDPTQLFQKLWGLLFCSFQYVKVPLWESWSEMTSFLTRTETSNRNNSRNNGNFDLLFFCKYSSFLMVYPIQAKNGRQCFQCSSPLINQNRLIRYKYLIIYIARRHNIGSRCLMGSKQCLP